MAIEVLDREGKKISEIEPKKEVFTGTVNEALFYETVKMQLARKRLGCASTKTRAEVSGSGRKPWKQKGTGRARSGSIRSPIWRHGGTVFGPHPRDYSYRIPKKSAVLAVKSAIQHKINEGKIKLFDSFDIPGPKTRLALEILKKASLVSALIIADAADRNIKLATRNLKNFKLLDLAAINAYDILRYETLVMTKDAFEKMESRLGK